MKGRAAGLRHRALEEVTQLRFTSFSTVRSLVVLVRDSSWPSSSRACCECSAHTANIQYRRPRRLFEREPVHPCSPPAAAIGESPA